jgi:HK97 family phage major capsid protein
MLASERSLSPAGFEPIVFVLRGLLATGEQTMALTAPSKSLREQELIPRAKEIRRLADLINNEKRDFNAEEKAAWEKVNAEYESFNQRVQVLETAEKREADLNSPENPEIVKALKSERSNGRKLLKRLKKMEKGPEKDRLLQQLQEERKAKLQARRGWLRESATEEDRCNALQAWCRLKTGRALKWYHKEAIQKTGLNVRRRDLVLDIMPNGRQVQKLYRENRALAVNVNTAGGYTVPEGFVQNLEIALLAYAQPRQWATVMRTASGQDLPWPTVNDTTNKGAILAENAPVTQQDITFGQIVFHAYKYTSKMVLVPVELMEDSAFDLAAMLGELLGIRIGRIQADHFTTGTGASQPTGYITAGTQGITAASPTAISADDIYNLKHSVDPAYRIQGGVGFTMHDQILLRVKLLKDGLGRYLWQASLAGGAPDTLDGDPIYINQSMASTVSSGTITMAYGALKKYVIRDVSQVRLRRLVERFADSDQEAFLMFMRSDANLLDAGTHPIKYTKH